MADPLLTVLVNIINAQPGSSIALTLTVKGLIVTGDLAPVGEYFEWFDHAFVAGNKLPDQQQGAAQQQGDMFAPLAATETVADPSHLHMKNVKFVRLDGGKLEFKGPAWWRGRINEVDGIMLGSL